jgi:lipopolysaccharide transport system permease protein
VSGVSTHTAVAIRTPTSEPLRTFLHPAHLARTLWSHRMLIAQFTKREVLEKHKGAYLGVLWNVLSPLLTLGAFTFVFGFVFQKHWGNTGAAGPLDFAINFFTGHTLFHVLAESVSRAPTCVASRPNLVRKVVFPTEVLPVSVVASTLVYEAVALGLLAILVTVVTGTVSSTIWLFPLLLVPLVMLSLGLAWLLASLGAFIRDVRSIVGVITQLLLFLSAVFYPISAIPEQFRPFVEYNPIAIIIESGRRTLIEGAWPDMLALGWVTLLSALIMQCGYAWYMRMRRGLADVL